MSDHSALPPLSDRLRREVDPLGTESAMSTPPPNPKDEPWTGEQVKQLINDCVRATRIQFRFREVFADHVAPDNAIIVDEQVEYFMRGFVIARGFDVDIIDALLVALNFEPHAV